MNYTIKNTIIILFISLASIGSGFWISKNMTTRYFIEEYYVVQNLDPNNEKNAEVLRQKIQQLIQKTIPARYRPTPDKFQCFKIISESVFFCSAETYRKNVALYTKKLLQETIPQEIGWIPQEQAANKFASIKAEIQSNQTLITDLSRQLDKIKKSNTKQQADEKKFTKTNDLYKKNMALLDKKMEVLKKLIPQALSPDARASYQLLLEETQAASEGLNQEYSVFKEKNRQFAKVAEQRDVLVSQINEIKEANIKDQNNLKLVEETLASPNSVGKIADAEEFQLIPDQTRQKFDPQQKETNLIWFSLAIFFALTNFVFRLKPSGLIPFQEDATMTEAKLS